MFPIKDSIRIPEPPLIVYILIAINAVVFLYQYSLPARESYILSLQYALVPRRYFDPLWASNYNVFTNSYWPFITGTFMHGGWLHIILNMWTLYIFGSSLEGRIGRLQFLTFYLVCGVAASFTHAWFNQDSTVPALGASGAIAGVTAAYAATFPRAKVTLLVLVVIVPLFFKIPALAFALIWFVLQFFQGFVDLFSSSMGGGIAWWAHIGGFVAGFVLIPLWRFKQDRTIDEEAPRWRGSVPVVGISPRPAPQNTNPSQRTGPWG